VQVIPAVDVLEGGVVRLQEGDFERRRLYGNNPVAMAEQWVEEGANLVHVVDLNGARTGQPDPGLWTGFAEAGIPFQIGGGIRTIASAHAAVEAGVQRVVLGTISIWNPELLGEIVGTIGSQKVVAALDVRAGRALGDAWIDKGRELAQVLADLVSTGVQHILVTSVNRDGTMQGPDLDLIGQISEAAPSMAVIASGGVGTLDHLRALALTGARAVIVGRALYEGHFTYQEAAQVSRAAVPADADPAHSAVVVQSLTENHRGEEA
jgi:phosphoribosylformimino-5-aminoimidazole carboxamide ribotide isomerase